MPLVSSPPVAARFSKSVHIASDARFLRSTLRPVVRLQNFLSHLDPPFGLNATQVNPPAPRHEKRGPGPFGLEPH